MKVSKQKILKKISNDLSLTSRSSSSILESFISIIISNSKTRVIKLSGFGSFNYKKTIQRLGRNPKTKESYIIHPRNKLTFKPSNKIKEILN